MFRQIICSLLENLLSYKSNFKLPILVYNYILYNKIYCQIFAQNKLKFRDN